MIITYDVAKRIKDIVSNDFDLYLHFHDSCGGQYFNFDEKPSDEVYTAIKKFFSEIDKKIVVKINDDKMSFYLQ